MTSIVLKGREIPLIYTTYEMKAVQEEIAPLSVAFKILTGQNPDDPEDKSQYGSAKHLEAMAKLIQILGNAGLEETGQEPNLTEKGIMRAMKPNDLIRAFNECMNAISEGMSSEIPEKETGPVDVTLEEMKKKEVKVG